jgi:hypothetical protein
MRKRIEDGTARGPDEQSRTLWAHKCTFSQAFHFLVQTIPFFSSNYC